MKRFALACALSVFPLGGCQLAAAPVAAPVVKAAKPMKISDFKLQTLAGQPLDARKFDGQVVLIVNTASKCGFTKQYAGLQQLHEKYEKQGLRVVGVPSNDFKQQEPGSASEIGEFCQRNYGVTFQMLEKTPVLGANKTPLFKWLTEEANPELKGEIGWNFEKFLVGRDGKLIARWKSKVTPESSEITSAIEKELAKSN